MSYQEPFGSVYPSICQKPRSQALQWNAVGIPGDAALWRTHIAADKVRHAAACRFVSRAAKGGQQFLQCQFYVRISVEGRDNVPFARN